MRNQFEHLSFDEMHSLAPSIFAETPHESRSDRYVYIPTIQIVEGMMKEGFLPFSAMQARSRSDSRREYTKHLIRFRHAEMLKGTPHVGQLFPEIVLINSHDGSTAYQLMSGIFRLVCTNGMITLWRCCLSRAASIALKASRKRSFHAAAFLPVKPIARKAKPSRVSR